MLDYLIDLRNHDPADSHVDPHALTCKGNDVEGMIYMIFCAVQQAPGAGLSHANRSMHATVLFEKLYAVRNI